MDGCTKTEADFEFVLGHKKFLLAIVKFLKKHLAENGVDSFSVDKKHSKNVVTKKAAEKKIGFTIAKKVVKLDPLVEYAIATELEFQPESSKVPQAILTEHRKVLLKKALNSMGRIAPKLFDKVRETKLLQFLIFVCISNLFFFFLNQEMEAIKKKISGDFLTFALDEDADSTANIKCVFCKKNCYGFSKTDSKQRVFMENVQL